MYVVIVGGAVALMFVTIWHELGHLLVAKLAGIPVARINVGFGPTIWRRMLTADTQLVLRAVPAGMSIAIPGRREPDGRLRRPVSHDLAMAAGGPLASFVLTVILILVAVVVPPESFWFTWSLATGLLSGFVAILNLAPIPGLDGGHLLLLVAASRGWQFSPKQEIRVHRYGLQAMFVVVMIPLILSGWSLLTT